MVMLGLVPNLPWTLRMNVRMASPAALMTLQLYKPLSDTWDRENMVMLCMGLGWGAQDSPKTSRPQNISEEGPFKYAGLAWETKGERGPLVFPKASRSERTDGR